MNILEMKPHPLAAGMPKLKPHEYKALKQSIKEQGFDQRYKVVVWTDPKIGEPRILDGVNRRDAAKELGMDRIPFETFEGDHAAAVNFVASRQAGRRSPEPSQRAGIGAFFRKHMNMSIEDAAEYWGCSISQMEKASSIAHKSTSKLKRIIKGELTVNEAANALVRITPEEHSEGEDPWKEIQRTMDKLKAAEEALVKWANEYIDPVIDRRGAEMLRANLVSRGKMVAGKRVLGLGFIEEMLVTIKRNKPLEKCPTCNGTGCQDCGGRRYVTAHERAQAKNAERNGKG